MQVSQNEKDDRSANYFASPHYGRNQKDDEYDPYHQGHSYGQEPPPSYAFMAKLEQIETSLHLIANDLYGRTVGAIHDQLMDESQKWAKKLNQFEMKLANKMVECSHATPLPSPAAQSTHPPTGASMIPSPHVCALCSLQSSLKISPTSGANKLLKDQPTSSSTSESSRLQEPDFTHPESNRSEADKLLQDYLAFEQKQAAAAQQVNRFDGIGVGASTTTTNGNGTIKKKKTSSSLANILSSVYEDGGTASLTGSANRLMVSFFVRGE